MNNHLNINKHEVTYDGTPLRVEVGSLDIEYPDLDEPTRVTLTLFPSRVTIDEEWEDSPKEAQIKRIQAALSKTDRLGMDVINTLVEEGTILVEDVKYLR